MPPAAFSERPARSYEVRGDGFVKHSTAVAYASTTITPAISNHDLIRSICRFADARGAGDSRIDTGIDGLAALRSRNPTDLQPMAHDPLFRLVLQGSQEIYSGNNRATLDAGESMIASLDVPSISRVVDASPAVPYVALELKIDLTLVRELFAELCQDETVTCDARPVACGASEHQLVEAMGRLFGLVERPFEARVLVPLLTREIHFRLMLADHGGMLRRLSQSDSHASRIARSIAHIRSDFAKHLRVSELAEMAGMSPSTFHHHFKSLTGTTPVQFQKGLRLLEARRRLLTEKTSVSSAAFQVGYESPTQFSRDYSRRFGVSPREDRRRPRSDRNTGGAGRTPGPPAPAGNSSH